MRHPGAAISVALYGIASLAGITWSSLGVGFYRQQEEALDSTWGDPNTLRSDEFLTQTPIELNVVANGESSQTPLAETGDLVFQLSSGQFFESLLFLENNILRLGPWLPDQMVFAAVRLFPWLLLALALPPLLRRFGASTPLAWLAVGLLIFNPTSLWWSFTTVRICAYAAAGSLLLILAKERLPERGSTGRSSTLARVGAVAMAMGAGMFLARMATYYVPWGIAIGAAFAVATGLYLLRSAPLRTSLISIGIGALWGGVLLVGTFWGNWSALDAQMNTLYPGDRRATGASLPLFHLFGAPGITWVQDAHSVGLPNMAEISSAFAICAVWALLIAQGGLGQATRAQRAVVWTFAGAVTAVFLWSTITWSNVGADIPLLNLIPPPRTAQIVGLFASILLCIVLSLVGPLTHRRAFVAALVCALVTGYGVSSLTQAMPDLPIHVVWGSSAAVFVVVWALSRWPRWFVVAPVVGVLVLAGAPVNPTQVGLGELRASRPADTVRDLGEEARADGEYLIADSLFLNALMVANGAPTISGYQSSGPDAEAWREFVDDPSQEWAWNRGASFVTFSFAGAPGSAPLLDAPNPDIISVTVDPCSLHESLDVRYLITGAKMSNDCLTPVSRFRWTNAPQFVYRVS